MSWYNFYHSRSQRLVLYIFLFALIVLQLTYLFRKGEIGAEEEWYEVDASYYELLLHLEHKRYLELVTGRWGRFNPNTISKRRLAWILADDSLADVVLAYRKHAEIQNDSLFFSLLSFPDSMATVLGDSLYFKDLRPFGHVSSRHLNPLPVAPKLFPFDPNSLDSLGYLKLGFSARQVHYFMAAQRAGGFASKAEFMAFFLIDSIQEKRLAEFVQLPDAVSEQMWDLNTASAMVLEQVSGVGEKISAYILTERAALRGFKDWAQLGFVYGVDSILITQLRKKSYLSPCDTTWVKINYMSKEALQDHPYINRTLARQIIRYREAFGFFEDLEQLRLLSGFPSDKRGEYLLKYCTLER